MTRSPSRPHAGAAALLTFALAAVGACTGPAGVTDPTDSSTASDAAAQDSPAAGTGPSSSAGGGSGPAAAEALSVVPSVRVRAQDVVTGLAAPWGLAALPDGDLLVSLRDERRLIRIDPETRAVQRVVGPGADELTEHTVARGESGLLGVAVEPAGVAHTGGGTETQGGTETHATDGAATAPDSPADIIVYRTAADGNEVLRGQLAGTRLSALRRVIGQIPAATHHDGGGVAFGPDGFLYVSTGDAGEPSRAQDVASPSGKILRLTPEGDVPATNADPASPVWSLGHRNVQGLGWDAAGRMFASEFGQNTWDELNVVVPAGNYGWPDREGAEGPNRDYVDPVATWSTAEASPSGIAVTRDAVYLAALRGQRLWRVPFAAGADDAPTAFGRPQVVFDGVGRLRAVLVDPARPPASDGSAALYVLTNNTDGRGSPRAGDDRLLRVTVTPAG